VQALITELNKAVGSFVAKGGVSQDPNNNPDYNNVVKLTQRAESIKQRYAALNDDILKYLTTVAKNDDLAGLLKENGELQKQINRLEKIQDELLRTRNTEVTRHQLFILDRPVRRGLIPYLWVIAVLFIGIGLVIFKMTMPVISTNGAEGASFVTTLMEFFTNKIVLSSLLGSAIIVIIFLSLKIGGVFGK
jgi:hypothetical protein